MKWPNTIPEDLRKRMDATLSHRSVSSATLWGDVVEWLIKHDVPAPGHPLPEAAEIEGELLAGYSKRSIAARHRVSAMTVVRVAERVAVVI